MPTVNGTLRDNFMVIINYCSFLGEYYILKMTGR